MIVVCEYAEVGYQRPRSRQVGLGVARRVHRHVQLGRNLGRAAEGICLTKADILYFPLKLSLTNDRKA